MNPVESLVSTLFSLHIADPKYKELILEDVKKTIPHIMMDEIDYILDNYEKRSQESYLYNSAPTEKIKWLLLFLLLLLC